MQRSSIPTPLKILDTEGKGEERSTPETLKYTPGAHQMSSSYF